MVARAGLAWAKRTQMVLDVDEPLAAKGFLRVTAPGFEADGRDVVYRITRTEHNSGRRATWELFVLRRGAARHVRVPRAFSTTLRVVQDLAGIAEAAHLRTIGERSA